MNIKLEPLKIKYSTKEAPSVESLYKSLKALNNISKALTPELAKEFGINSLGISLKCNSIEKGSIFEDIHLYLTFGNKEDYEKFLKKLGGLPMWARLPILLLIGSLTWLLTTDMTTNINSNNPIRISNYGTINVSPEYAKCLAKNVPNLIKPSVEQDFAPITMDGTTFTREDVKKLASLKEPKDEVVTQEFINTSVKFIIVNTEGKTGWKGSIPSKDIATLPIEFSKSLNIMGIAHTLYDKENHTIKTLANCDAVLTSKGTLLITKIYQ